MDLSRVNYVAVFVAALSSFLIGGLWYSPILFARAWMRESGLDEARLKQRVGAVFGGAFVMSFITAWNLALMLGENATIAWGASAGALAGIGFAATSLATVFLFERKTWMLILIDGGYLAVSFTVMGTVIALIQ
jgi:hypothetical protein